MINSVYNYLAQSYPQKSYTKYSLHNNNELKSIYHAIINKNSQSPLYLVNLSKETSFFALGVKEAAMLLHDVVSSLSDVNDDSIFASKVAQSSNNSVIDVQIINPHNEELPTDFSLKVNSIASSQVNTSREVLSSSKALEPGAYGFTISVEDNLYEFQFNVSQGSTSKDIQLKLVDFINTSNIGLEAHLDPGTTTDYNKISLKSKATGTSGELIFTLQDLPNPNNRGIVDFFNLNYVSDYPKNSFFVLNDKSKESMSNTFILNKSLGVTLHSASEELVSIRYVPDHEKILHSVTNVIETYNNLISLADRNKEDHKRATKLISDVTHIADNYRDDLSSNGLIISEDKHIIVESSLLLSSVKNGNLAKLFTDKFGYTSKLLDQLNDIILNPMEYLDKIIVSYPNPTKQVFPNPYITSIYSGMLFNYYC